MGLFRERTKPEKIRRSLNYSPRVKLLRARTTDYDRNLFETGRRVSQSESETRIIRDPSISWCNRPSLRPTRCIDGRTHSPLSSFAVIFFSLSSTYPARLFSPAANQFSFVSDPTCSSSSSRAPQLCKPVYANKTRKYRCFVITDSTPAPWSLNHDEYVILQSLQINE